MTARTITMAQADAATHRSIESRGISDWRIQLSVRQGNLLDTDNSIGVAPTAKDGFDAQFDTEKPPVVAGAKSIRLSIDGNNETGRAASFSDVVRAATPGTKSWDVAVEASQDGEATVFWPNISRLPQGLEAYLVDTTTGRRIAMRSSSSYRFQASGRAAHRFQVQVVRANAKPLAFLNTQIHSGGRALGAPSYRVNFTTTQEADVVVEIQNFAGQTLRLLQTKAVSSAETSMSWDGKDAKGAVLPTGAYRITLTARDDSGHVVRQILPFATVR